MKNFTWPKSTSSTIIDCCCSKISGRKILKTGVGTMVPILLFFLFLSTSLRAQVNIPLTDEVIANFGVEADVYANVNEIIDNALFDNTDDWFEDLAQWPGSGEGVIDVTSAEALALISQWEVDNNDNIAGELRQSVPIYSIVDGRIWIDAVYGRDQRTNGNLSDMSFFTSGDDKNFQDPETWTIGTGSGGPQKNDIIEFVGHLRRDMPMGGEILGTEYAIFGASTRSQNGTSHLDFELFRAPVELIGGTLVSEGADCNRTAYEFNPDGSVLTHGDVIFSVNYENGGDNVKVELFIWIDRTEFPNDAAFESYNALANNPFEFGSASSGFNFYECNTDPNFGYAQISLVSALSSDWVTAQINEIPVTGPPWGTYNSGGNLVEKFPTLAFIEISLNATALGLDTGTTSGSCQNPLGSVLVKTRSSASFTAELKDLSGPYQLGDTPEVSVTLDDEQLNCTLEYVTLEADVLQAGDYKYEWFKKDEMGNYQPVDDSALYGDEEMNPENDLRVDEAGEYKVKVTRLLGDGSEGCFDEDEATVTGTNDAPTLETTCPPEQNVTCEDDITAAFTAWLDGFDVTGGGGTVDASYTVVINGGDESDPIDFSDGFDGLSAPADVCAGGSVTINLRASDDCDQITSCSSTFNLLKDETAPTLEGELPMGEEDLDLCYADIPAGPSEAEIAALYSDNCGGDITVVKSGTPTGDDCSWSVTYNYTIADKCDNFADEVNITYSGSDQTDPEIQLPEYEAEICEEEVPESLTATWTDNCSDGGEIIAFPVLVGEDECSMTYKYVFEIEDDCENPAYEEIFITREIDLVENCETIFGYANSDVSQCFLEDDFNRWGWTNHLTAEGSYELTLYAGAGQCDRSKGAVAGTATIDYFNDEVTVSYNVEGYVLSEAHVYIGCTPYPLKNGKPTVAPGQYNFNPSFSGYVQNYTVGPIDVSDLDGEVYVIVHGVACEVVCKCSDGSIVGSAEGGSSFVDDSATCTKDATASVTDGNTGNGNGRNSKIAETGNFNASPVPFNDKLTLQYDFEYTSNKVDIQIYDLNGRLLRTYSDKRVTRGDIKELNIDFTLKANQVYIIRMVTDFEVLTKNVISSARK